MRLAFALPDLESLASYSLSDDAFYYYGVARHILAGQGPSFDGVEPTNGFHPLWMAVCVGVFALLGGLNDLSLHALLVVEALLGLAAAPLLVGALRRLGLGPWWSLLPAAAYLGNVRLVQLTVNGMETALAVFLVALLLHRFAAWLAAGHQLRHALQVGLAGGLAALARPESLLLVGLVAVAMVVTARGRWQHAGLALGPALLLWAPWPLWNLWQFGTWEQVSGWLHPALNRARFAAEHQADPLWSLPAARFLLLEWLQMLGRLYYLLFLPRFAPPWWLGLPIALLAAALLVPLLLKARSLLAGARRLFLGRPDLLAFTAVLLVWPAAFFAAHTLLRFAVTRPYYSPLVAPAVLMAGTILVWPAGRSLATGARGSLRVVSLAALVLLLVALHTRYWLDPPPEGMQQAMIEASRWLRENLPPNAVVGSHNAGLLSYFSQRTVVNLDGLINNGVAPYLLSGTLERYLDQRGVTHLADLTGRPRDLFDLGFYTRAPATRTLYYEPVAYPPRGVVGLHMVVLELVTRPETRYVPSRLAWKRLSGVICCGMSPWSKE